MKLAAINEVIGRGKLFAIVVPGLLTGNPVFSIDDQKAQYINIL
jgi:hypothetical protein